MSRLLIFLVSFNRYFLITRIDKVTSILPSLCGKKEGRQGQKKLEQLDLGKAIVEETNNSAVLVSNTIP